MQLNQTTLRGILAEILSVDESRIVPKQGNWWNPQKRGANVSDWVAYRIKRSTPRTPPFYAELSDGAESAVVLKVSSIELQFVGPLSEELSQSVAMWPLREDVRAAFAKVRGSVLLEGLEAIPSDFYQDGANTVTAWNVADLRVAWFDAIETKQKPLRNAVIGGKIG